MSKKLIGTSKLSELPIGHFASVNGNIVYRFRPDNGTESYWFPPGIFVIEKHGHLPMHDAFRGYDTGKAVDERGYFCDPIGKPEKQHVDQAINLLKKSVKDQHINGLMYLDNYVTLKEYLKLYAKV